MREDSGAASWGVTLLRLVVGAVFFVHGCQKLFVYGIPGVIHYFTSVGVPSPELVAPSVAVLECIGGAGLISGLRTRWAAALLAIDMMGAIVTVKWKGGFFAPAGFEYELTLLVACLSLVLMGPGSASVEGMLQKRK